MRCKWTPFNAIAGSDRLRYCKIRILHAPGPYVLANSGDCPRRSKFALNAGVHGCCKELANERTEQNVAPLITGQKRRFPPRPPHFELERCRKLARMQVLFCKWSSLMKRAAVDRNPVAEGSRIQIHKLPEQVLIQLYRRRGIAADGELNPRVHRDRRAEKMKYRTDPTVESRVIGVPILDQRGATGRHRTGWRSGRPNWPLWKRNAAARVPLRNHSADGRPSVEVQTIARRTNGFDR